MEILIISGLSGAGKSRAASFLEDMGFYIVDNMPAAMILKFAEFCAGGSQRYDKVALVYDVRTANSPTELFDVLDVLKHSSGACSLLFLEAEPETIIKRYKETRRRHPLMQQADSLEKAVRTEQEMMEPLRQRADVVIDTTHLSTAQLRGELLRHFGSDTTEKGGMSVTITSFGFKYGLPMEADLVFDVRCMPNPFYIPELREKTGLDQPVADYVFSFRQTHDFVEKLRDIQVQLAREEQEKSEERNVQNKLSIQRYRLERAVKLCDEANEMLYRISREFDAIERRYNMLIEQKTVFASRAAARIRYILMEGAVEEDQTIAFVNLLTQSEKRDEILDKLSQKMKLTEPYRVMNEKSLYQRRDRKKEAFVPQAVAEVTEQADSEEMNEYVLKPLYTQKEIREFRKQNEQEGNFIVTKDTVKSMEDLEKLFLVWQNATEVAEGTEEIEVGEELENENGLRFSKLVIKKSQ